MELALPGHAELFVSTFRQGRLSSWPCFESLRTKKGTLKDRRASRRGCLLATPKSLGPGLLQPLVLFCVPKISARTPAVRFDQLSDVPRHSPVNARRSPKSSRLSHWSRPKLNLVNNSINCEEMFMNDNRLPSYPSDTLIGIVIATIGTLVLLARLNVFTVSFNLPGDLVTWWPLLLISAGVVLLFVPEKARR